MVPYLSLLRFESRNSNHPTRHVASVSVEEESYLWRSIPLNFRCDLFHCGAVSNQVDLISSMVPLTAVFSSSRINNWVTALKFSPNIRMSLSPVQFVPRCLSLLSICCIFLRGSEVMTEAYCSILYLICYLPPWTYTFGEHLVVYWFYISTYLCFSLQYSSDKVYLYRLY